MRVDVNNVEPRHCDRGDVRVIKNFLPRTFFLHLRDLVMGGDFPWYYNNYTTFDASTIYSDAYGSGTIEIVEFDDVDVGSL